MERRDPAEDVAHDVPPADEFAMPAADPELHHHGPVTLPDDPAGVGEPHDILAAEEFPMPTPRHHPADGEPADRPGGPARLIVQAIVAALLLVLLSRRIRRR